MPDQKAVTLGKVSYEKMWAEIAAKCVPTEIPPGGKTIITFAEEHRISPKQAECRLAAAERRGLLRIERMNLLCPNGTTRMTRVYFPAEAK